MPFLLVADRHEMDAHPRNSVRALVRLGAACLDVLSSHFKVETFTVWDGSPEETFMSRQITSGQGLITATDLRASVPSDYKIEAAESMPLPGLRGGLKEPHVLRLEGHFDWPGHSTVPAEFWLNLYPPWADRNGHISFDTFATIEEPSDGIYQLLSKDPTNSRGFLERLMESIVIPKEDRRYLTIHSAAVKETAFLDDFRELDLAIAVYMPGKRPFVRFTAHEALTEATEIVRQRFPLEASGEDFTTLIKLTRERLESTRDMQDFIHSSFSSEGITAHAAASEYYISPRAGGFSSVVNSTKARLRDALVAYLSDHLASWAKIRESLKSDDSE